MGNRKLLFWVSGMMVGAPKHGQPEMKIGPGTMTADYHDDRLRRVDLKYRLQRRTEEVEKTIEKNCSSPGSMAILDIGTADGVMLSALNRHFGFKRAVGIDTNPELLKTNNDKSLILEEGKAEHLRFADNSFDIVVGTAVIEHVDDPKKMLSECWRVLKVGGIIVLTTPNPLHDAISELLKYYKNENHVETFSLQRLQELVEEAGFNTIEKKYFMACPFFKIPFEGNLESLIRRIWLEKIMSNQMLVAKKA